MTKIIAHRGYSSLYIENSIESFRKAYEHMADGVELDVHLSKDGEIIVHHDKTINRMTTKKGSIKNLNSQALSQIGLKKTKHSSYQTIPLLADVLYHLEPTPLLINIEVKSPSVEMCNKLIEVIESFDIGDRVIISSFHLDFLKMIKEHNVDIHTAFLYSKLIGNLEQTIKDNYIDSIHPHLLFASRSIMDQVMPLNAKVRVYTVNKKADIEYYIGIGVDAIITDKVELAYQIREAMNGK